METHLVGLVQIGDEAYRVELEVAVAFDALRADNARLRTLIAPNYTALETERDALRAQRDELAAALQAVYDLRSDVQNIADKLGKRFATSPNVNKYQIAFEQARAALAKVRKD